eukprot:CAMPEP_0113549438 /NCGR_PEP_ID=MMETSP0015_2-20120614/13432_1 /TAXON_ID=2838 /ORGANISM="Odontella" /LENGTH=65 /DNA_ID=CAMNT_0000450145 /DNA_START=131 /DNA_END=325 /DNA_ORIENTATION=+ /assembly_acc=CAM_ASM_000160
MHLSPHKSELAPLRGENLLHQIRQRLLTVDESIDRSAQGSSLPDGQELKEDESSREAREEEQVLL